MHKRGGVAAFFAELPGAESELRECEGVLQERVVSVGMLRSPVGEPAAQGRIVAFEEQSIQVDSMYVGVVRIAGKEVSRELEQATHGSSAARGLLRETGSLETDGQPGVIQAMKKGRHRPGDSWRFSFSRFASCGRVPVVELDEVPVASHGG